MTADLDRAAVARRALSLLDLTNLNDDCTEADISALCAKAKTPHGAVAAVCLWPRFVAQARHELRGSAVRVATVANFPTGNESVGAVLAETGQSVADGADEVDLVLPYRAFIDGNQDEAIAMVGTVRESLGTDTTLKVILETGEFPVPDLIAIASARVIQAGADFLKTSTGKVAVNATEEAARIMIEAIRHAGLPVGFKAAGGIRTAEDAAGYFAVADEIMGPDWVSAETFRFGASGLLNDLLAAIEGGAATPSEGY